MTSPRSLRRSIVAVASSATAAGAVWSAYLTVIGVAAARSLRDEHRGVSRSAPPATRFRVLVPAHDEEKNLGATLESLLALEYPAELVEVHVVADNCTDATARIAREWGVQVHERTDAEHRGKGAALAWLIDRLPPGGPGDAMVVIDADTVVDPGTLLAFERALATGIAAVQGYYGVKDAAAGGEVGFRAAALAVRHLVRPAGRTALGGSSSLYGNGMAFRESIARRYRWSNSLTEDLEMGMRLLLDGHTVGFAPDAMVEAEMPATLDAATSQNERWEAGRLQVATAYLPLLLHATRRARGRRWAHIDAAIDISMPPLTMVMATTLAGGAGMIVTGRGRGRWIGSSTAAVAAGLQVAHVLHALRLAGTPPSVRRSLVRAPAQIAWKSRLVARVARRGPRSWIRTSREPAVAAA